jgi:uncharacterized membrane protein
MIGIIEIGGFTMWKIGEIKERGRAALRLNYWKCVLVSFIMGFVASGTSSVSINRVRSDENVQQAITEMTDMYNGLTPGQRFAVAAAVSGVITLIIIVSVLLRIFLYNPLKVGGLSFFKMNVIDPPADLNDISAGFKNYLHTFVTLFLMDLFNALWFCLFIIPGFVKAYSYRMVPYILADEPDLSPTETITRSRQMMDGHKWHSFLYDLTFFGWGILALLTCGLVGVFWVTPYKYNSDAALYLAIRDEMEPDYDALPAYPDEPMPPVDAEPVQHVDAEVVQPEVVEEAPQQAAEATEQTAAEEAPQQTVEAEEVPQTAEEAPQAESEEVQQNDNK